MHIFLVSTVWPACPIGSEMLPANAKRLRTTDIEMQHELKWDNNDVLEIVASWLTNDMKIDKVAITHTE